MTDPWLNIDLKLQLKEFELNVSQKTNAKVLGIYGPSGAGKTSLLEALAGLRRGAVGGIEVFGQCWLGTDREMSPEDRGVGYVPQSHLLFPHLNVRENLRFALPRAKNEEETYKEVVKVLELDDLLDRRVGSLSGGECQRVALGRALCSGPKVLLLDEPMSSLDGDLKHRILPFLLKIKDQFGIPMILVSHQPLEVQALCGEVIALKRGRVLKCGSAFEVLSDTVVSDLSTPFENLIQGTVERHDGDVTHVQLKGCSSTSVAGPSSALNIGEACFFSVPSSDILLGIGDVSMISARNQIPGNVIEIQEGARQVRVMMQIGEYERPIAVDLTLGAIEELGIQIGVSATLLIKTNSFRR